MFVRPADLRRAKERTVARKSVLDLEILGTSALLSARATGGVTKFLEIFVAALG
jgi:hypothetical protein